MSLIITDLYSGKDISCKTFLSVSARGFVESRILIGDYEISATDFSYLVMYFMTNLDLSDNDVRLALQKKIGELGIKEGSNEGGSRLDTEWGVIR